MGMMSSRRAADDPFERNAGAIARANAALMQRVAFCSFANMVLMSASSPRLMGFSGSARLYMISALLTGLFSVYCLKWKYRFPRAVKPLFYALLGGLSWYAVMLSSFYYPDIHGVSIVGIFMLIPMVILDRGWRVNLIFFLYYAVSCVCALARKPIGIAVDDIVTCGGFMVFGMLIGSYLRGARLLSIDQKRQLEYQRDSDELTGLPNRRLLFETLGYIDRAGGEGSALGMVMIDIDDFKGYNDRNGHLAGDQCLRKMGARLLASAAEGGLTVYRYGGEEFLGVWRQADPERIAAFSQKLVEDVRTAFAVEGVTVSVGYATRLAGEDVSTERLIGMADGALYEAKSLGRDRAVRFRKESAPPPMGSTLRQRT